MTFSHVISNAGPLMVLAKLNRLELLADLYHEVQIPQEIYHEVVTQGAARGAADALTFRLFWQHRRWPIVEMPADALPAYQSPVLLHPGELAVLALAQTSPRPLVLLDDEVARTEARRLGLPVRGSLGVLVQAYRQQLLTRAQVTLLIEEVGLRPDIWISTKLCQQVLAAL